MKSSFAFHPFIAVFSNLQSVASVRSEASIKDEVLDRDRHRDETGTWSTDTMQFQVVAPEACGCCPPSQKSSDPQIVT